MNILEFIRSGGRVVTAHGKEVIITTTTGRCGYPIIGLVQDIRPYECQWDEHGYPWHLPTTHGLNLLATLPITSYRTLTKAELKTLDSEIAA